MNLKDFLAGAYTSSSANASASRAATTDLLSRPSTLQGSNTISTPGMEQHGGRKGGQTPNPIRFKLSYRSNGVSE